MRHGTKFSAKLMKMLNQKGLYAEKEWNCRVCLMGHLVGKAEAERSTIVHNVACNSVVNRGCRHTCVLNTKPGYATYYGIVCYKSDKATNLDFKIPVA
jgi:hypothetical protein